MIPLSAVEENYLKYIFQLSEISENGIKPTIWLINWNILVASRYRYAEKVVG